MSRRAAIQRTLLPVLLGWFADAAEPDAGLLAFRQVSEALGSSPWYLRLLRDETKAAERMAHVLASSRYAAGLLLRAPEAVAIFGNDAELSPRSLTGLRAEMMAAIQRYEDDAEAAVTAVRSVRRRELLRTAAADVLARPRARRGRRSPRPARRSPISPGASLQAALAVALRKVSAELRPPLPTRFAVIAMGRFGGHECGYGSDADVLFVHDPLPGRPEKEASDAAHAVAAELRRLLMLPVPDPALIVDADLRPEGRQGPLVRTLASYRAYYRRWSAPWEAQALLRAESGAGDEDLGARFTRMIAEFRYPLDGISPAGPSARSAGSRREWRPNASRAAPTEPCTSSWVRAACPTWSGRYSCCSCSTPTRCPRCAPPAPARPWPPAVQAGLLAAEDAAQLTAAWELAARIRNAIVLVGGRPGDTLPAKHAS